MTPCAVLEIADPFPQVLSLDPSRVVFVAAIARVLFEVRRHVARLACAVATLAVIDRERVIKCCALPGGRSVTLRAVRAKCTQMFLRLGMTAHASLGGAFIHTIDVALGAGHVDVRAREFERRQIVIELGIFPVRWVMALRAVRAKCALMLIVFQVTTHTCLRRAFEDVVNVALRTLDAGMFAL